MVNTMPRFAQTVGWLLVTALVACGDNSRPVDPVDAGIVEVRAACAVHNGGCDVHAGCSAAPEGVECSCNAGYAGDGKTCVAVDSCQANNGGCDVHATCTDAGAGTHTCFCAPNYAGDGTSCAPIDACLTSNGGCDAHAACTDTGPGARSCSCSAGYSGTGESCAPIDRCLTANGGCDAHAACTATGPGTNVCACTSGYAGNGATCAPIDSCLTSNGGCDAHAICASTGPGTNSCACSSGYAGTGTSCAPVDSCLIANGGCDTHATCTTTGPGTNSCACSSGYAGSGTSCAPIDSCLTGNGGCDMHAACASTGPGTNSCACSSGYAGTGTACAPIDSCLTANGGCDAHATCTATGPGTNTCACNSGYAGGGTSCAPIDSCLVNHGGCDANATCTITGAGTNTCACAAGYTGSGVTCAPAINYCPTGSTRQITGAVHDTTGHPVNGLTVYASNADGNSSAVSDGTGAFSFYVPTGDVDVQLCVPGAWWTIMQDSNNPADPAIPGLVKCVGPVAWTCADGPLDFALPTASAISIHVTSGGQPVSGASVNVSADLTSTTFDFLPGKSGTVGFMPSWGARTTGASGALDFMFYPSTGTTFDVTASKVVNGVTLTKTVTNISTSVTSVEIALPGNPQLLVGTIHDTSGQPVSGLTVHGSNIDGSNSVNSDSNGDFSLYVPSGVVSVELCVPGAWWSIMQDANNPANPAIPGLVKCVDPVAWTFTDGALDLTMPTASPIAVQVTSGGQPVSGASVNVSADLTSTAFDFLPGISRTVGFMPSWGARTTGAGGALDFRFYPSTGTTFDVTATKVINGVTLTKTVTGISTSVTSIEIPLPGNPQLLTGTIHDTTGHPVSGLTVHGSNLDGSNSANSDSNGDFSLYVPAGAVSVELCVPGAWWSIMQDANNPANPAIPGLVKCVDPVAWTFTDGALDLTMPTASPIAVQVTSGGQPVSGASVNVSADLTSTAFDFLPGISRTVGFMPSWGARTTGASGALDFRFYPSTNTTFDVTATAVVNGVTLTGSLLHAPASGGSDYTVDIPGSVDLAVP